MAQYHESAVYHVTGTAKYIDDILIHPKPLYGFAILSEVAAGEIESIDYSEALKVKGIHAILSAKDLWAEKKIGAVIHDEPVLVEKNIEYKGQAILLIAADSEEDYLKAKEKIVIKVKEKQPILGIQAARKAGRALEPTRKIERGNIDEGFKKSDYVLKGTTHTGAQEQWYLETQASIAIPGEGNEMKIYSSSQNPNEVQILVSEVLGIDAKEVEVEVRRMGGAFGGKETQGATFAVWAALLAKKTGKPVKVRLERFIDQQITGKRHPFENYYKVGFDKEGKIIALDVELNSDGGAYADLSMAILERAMLHAENAYFIPNIRIQANVWLTNVPPNTAFRGFGGPQGIFNIENIINRISHIIGKDIVDVQRLNFYDETDRNTTPYGQIVENNHLYKIQDELLKSSNYRQRRKQVNEFNLQNKYKKRGIGVTPVKFGISFTTAFLNQAGALVNVYTDGTVLVNHGGTEMGQGLFTKMQKVAAAEFGIDLDKVKVNATNTAKVPNASATAASTGSDLNGMAVKNAVDKIKNNIAAAIAEEFNERNKEIVTLPEDLVFENNFIYNKKHPELKISFAKAASITRIRQKSLSSTGYYATPGIQFNRQTGKGTPFFYFAYGMAVSEVEVDLLTGKIELIRTDILHDVGDSINPDIDKGQIEGAFVQGMGWAILEDNKWNEKGVNITPSPDTYKIPAITDIPKDFRVKLLENVPNKNTIRRSKAVGEPPFILGLSAWFAVYDALWSITDYNTEPELNFPATNEYIVAEADRLMN